MQSLYTEILQTAEEKLESRRKSNVSKTELRLRTQNTTDDIDTRPDTLPQVRLIKNFEIFKTDFLILQINLKM